MDLEEITMNLLKEDEQIKEGKYVRLQEATVKDMYNQLDDTKGVDSVEGIIDDILVVTDPEVTSEEYDEVIERAQELIEDTPEGEIPFDEEYIGQYLLTCPICGTTFVSEEMLEPGATCPACMEVPEGFTVKGQIQTEEDVVIDNGLKVDDDQVTDEEVQPQSDITTDEDTDINTDIKDNEEESERQVASKEVPQGNKLQETKEEDKTIKTEDTYEEGIFYEIEEALREAGLNPVRFTEDGVMTNNLGWTVTGEDGTQQQITCDGSYLTESKSEEVTVGNIKQKAQELLPTEDIETHEGDLYLKVSDKSTELVSKLKDKESGLLKTFKSEKDNSMWYDIPFANMEDDYKLKNNLNECEIDNDFNDYYESKNVKTEDNNNDRLPVEGNEIEVIVTENSVGYLLRGLIIDHNNKQFQYVKGPSLPLGKYRRVSKNTMRSTIEQLQNEEYTEYKGKDSISLEENVQVAKFERYQVRKFVEDNNTKYGIYDLVERKFIQTDESIQKINEEYTKYKSE